MNEQGPSSSSASSSNSSSTSKQQRTMSSENVEGQVEVADSILDKLPPEMLMKILGYLNTQTLFLSRLISLHLNQVALEVLNRRRCLTNFTYLSSPETLNQSYIKWNGGAKTLKSFIICLYKSKNLKNFPFTRFRFSGIRRATFQLQEWLSFMCILEVRNNIKTLILEISYMANDAEMIYLSKMLSRLLLKQLPNLEEFGLSFSSFGSVTSTSALLVLFQSVDIDLDVGVGLEQAPTPQLPRLKTVHLDESSFSKYTGVVTDLLLAAVNLTEIVYNNEQSISKFEMLEHFLLLQSLGKLNCLQNLTIEPTLDLLSKIYEHPNQNPAAIIPAFKLKTLNLSLQKIHNHRVLNRQNDDIGIDQVLANTANFLSTILKSSKDTLTELDTKALGFLTGLELPVFSKLAHLIIQAELDQDYEDNQTYFTEAAFPPGIKMAETFPALRFFELGILWSSTTFPQEEDINSKAFSPISMPIPTLTRVDILGVDITEETIAQISRFAPNLKSFQIFEGNTRSIHNFPEVGPAIWTHMKQLQSLRLSVDDESQGNAFPAMDSTITGFSKEDCETLYDLMKADQLLKKRGIVAQIPQLELEVERKNPSILDLKDLRFLNIFLYGSDRREDRWRFKNLKAVTHVSKEHALKLMDKLFCELN